MARAGSSSWVNGRHAEDGDERRALVVHRDLLEPTVVAAQDALGRGAQRLEDREPIQSRIGHPGDVREDDGRPAQLGEPVRLSGIDPGEEHRRDVRARSGLLRRRERHRRQRSRGDGVDDAVDANGPRSGPIAHGPFGDQRPRFGRSHDLPIPQGGLEVGDLRDGLAADEEEPAAVHPTDVGRGERPGAEPDLQRQRQVGPEARLAHPRGHREPARCRAKGRGGEVLVGRLPDGDEGVAHDLRHVASVRGDDVHDLADIRVQRAREVLGAGRAPPRGRVGDGREPVDVDHEQGGGERLGMRLGSESIRQLAQNESRHVAHEGRCALPVHRHHDPLRL